MKVIWLLVSYVTTPGLSYKYTKKFHTKEQCEKVIETTTCLSGRAALEGVCQRNCIRVEKP